MQKNLLRNRLCRHNASMDRIDRKILAVLQDDARASLRATGGTKAYRGRIATQKERGLYTHIGDFSDFQARIGRNSSFTVEE